MYFGLYIRFITKLEAAISGGTDLVGDFRFEAAIDGEADPAIDFKFEVVAKVGIIGREDGVKWACPIAYGHLLERRKHPCG